MITFSLVLDVSISQTPPEIIDIIVQKLWESNSLTSQCFDIIMVVESYSIQ